MIDILISVVLSSYFWLNVRRLVRPDRLVQPILFVGIRSWLCFVRLSGHDSAVLARASLCNCFFFFCSPFLFLSSYIITLGFAGVIWTALRSAEGIDLIFLSLRAWTDP